jgi:iron complex transport system substrate-binding protein
MRRAVSSSARLSSIRRGRIGRLGRRHYRIGARYNAGCPLVSIAPYLSAMLNPHALSSFARSARPARLLHLLTALLLALPLAARAATSAATATPASTAAPLAVTDDSGTRVTLSGPARRIVTLSPHLTEIAFAAGAGDQLVGVVEYSDYPEAAKHIARIGDNRALDLERIAALKPDLILAWRHGNAETQLEALRALGIPIYLSAPRSVDDVATTLTRLGRLFGTEVQADRAAADYRARIAALRARYARARPVSVFYQVWDDPLMTLNGNHWISDVIALCGGRNVFAQAEPLVPTVSTEAVVAANPDAILTADAGATPSDSPTPGLKRWQAWPALTAVAQGNLFVLDGDLIDRPTPRLADGAALVCADLERARRKLH